MFSTGRLCVINYDTMWFYVIVIIFHFPLAHIVCERGPDSTDLLVLVTHKLRLTPVRSHSVAHGFPQALNGHCSCYTYSISHVHQQT